MYSRRRSADADTIGVNASPGRPAAPRGTGLWCAFQGRVHPPLADARAAMDAFDPRGAELRDRLVVPRDNDRAAGLGLGDSRRKARLKVLNRDLFHGPNYDIFWSDFPGSQEVNCGNHSWRDLSRRHSEGKSTDDPSSADVDSIPSSFSVRTMSVRRMSIARVTPAPPAAPRP